MDIVPKCPKVESSFEFFPQFFLKFSTPSPWIVYFSLVRFSFVLIFKTVPKYLVHAVYPF